MTAAHIANMSTRRIALVGAPVDVGAPYHGVRLGPEALRSAGLLAELRRRGRAVRDAGDLSHGVARRDNGSRSGRCRPAGRARNAEQVAGWARRLSDMACAVMRGGELPVFLGGDHSLAMGVVTGVARHWNEVGRELFLLWIDAHADCNTPFTTPTGNMHGMALAMLIGEGGFEPLFSDRRAAAVKPANACILGLRAVDPGELPSIRRRGVHVFGMRQIQEFGVRLPVQRLLDRVASCGGVLHVSLDMDALDPRLAGGVSTAVPDGLTAGQAERIVAMLHESGLVGSLDVSELNPLLDPDGTTARTAVGLVAGMLGGDRVGHDWTGAKETGDGRNAA